MRRGDHVSKSDESFALAVALMGATRGAHAVDDARYPDWKGQWDTINPRFAGQIIKFDPTKPWGPAQQAPLTPEYQKVLEDSMADQAKGGLGNYPSARCLPGGMPHMMAIPTQEYVVTPDTTYILLSSGDFRRIFTDGRDWPAQSRPMRAIRSADGSTNSAMGATTSLRSRRAVRSRDHVHMMPAGAIPLRQSINL